MFVDPSGNIHNWLGFYYDQNKGVLNSGFCYDSNQGIYYSAMYAWQRNFGYHDMYDYASPLAGIYFNYLKITFKYGYLSTKYSTDKAKWRIELWKGQYGIATGAEIGVYYRQINWATDMGDFYNCVNDEDRLYMEFTLYKNGTPLFSRELQQHWWLTGFKPFVLSRPSELSMRVIILFKSRAMTDAFMSEFTKSGIAKYGSFGYSVCFYW